MVISDRDLADLAYSGLLVHLKEKLEGHDFVDVSQVLQKALAQESRAKESRNFHRSSDKTSKNDRPGMNMVEYDSESSDDEGTDTCVAEWDWASKSKPFVCSALKPISHKREEIKYTFDVSKCDKIFDYLLQWKQIKLNNGHVIPSPEELKRRAYCK